MKISIRYENNSTFTGEIDAVEYLAPQSNQVILWHGNCKIELGHYKSTGNDWIHMGVMFKGRMVEFRNAADGFTLPVDYDKTYNDPALAALSSFSMRARQYINDVLHENITEEAALGKILADMFLKG